MKKIAAYLVLAIMLLSLSCQKKKYPESSDDTPVFYFRGTVNNSPVDLNAGVNNYYMYSGFSQNSDNVYSFSANLKTASCGSGCANSILISINDYATTPTNGAAKIDSSLAEGYYPLSLGSTTSNAAPVNFSALFTPLSNHGIASCYWQFGDGTTSNLLYPSHTYKKPGNYLISLTATDSFSCSNTISNFQRIGLGGVRASLTAVISPSSPVTFNCNLSNSPSSAYSYTFDYGDNSTVLISSIPSSGPFSFSVAAHNYAPGSYTARLKVADLMDAKDSATVLYNINPQGSSCATNFQLSSSPLFNPKAFSNVTITWTDASGKVYTSANSAQPAMSYFQILSVDNYENNTEGKKTKKLHVKFKCTLYDPTASSNSITLENAEAVVLVAYQ